MVVLSLVLVLLCSTWCAFYFCNHLFLLRKRELVVFLELSSCCYVIVRLVLCVPSFALQCVIVVVRDLCFCHFIYITITIDQLFCASCRVIIDC